MSNFNFGTFMRIGDIWQENDIVKTNSRYRVDPNYVEVFLIQLRISVTLTRLPTEVAKTHEITHDKFPLPLDNRPPHRPPL